MFIIIPLSPTSNDACEASKKINRGIKKKNSVLKNRPGLKNICEVNIKK
jgi:hypothetical protein